MNEQPWRALAQRGQLTAAVLSRARAEQDGIEIHKSAELVLLLHPDGADGASIVPLSCASIADVLTFIREMAPRSVDVEVGRFEDRAPLVALLERDGNTIH